MMSEFPALSLLLGTFLASRLGMYTFPVIETWPVLGRTVITAHSSSASRSSSWAFASL